VAAGDTVKELPVTNPIVLSRRSEAAPDTDQDKIADCPFVISEGFELNELIAGLATGRGGSVTSTVALAVETPPAFSAVNVYSVATFGASSIELRVTHPTPLSI
jgi:hypothetical protein